MKSGYSANFKVCVTCDYWTGARSLNSTRTRAEYDAGVLGDCLFGGRKITHKSPTASCNNYEKWAQLRSTSNNQGTRSESSSRRTGTSTSRSTSSGTSKNNGKGIIPLPVAIAAILLVALLRFLADNWTYLIRIIPVVIICIVACIIIYKKAHKPIVKMILTILVGIIISTGLTMNLYQNNKNIQIKKTQLAQSVKNATVKNGYIPCFGSYNKYSNEYEKIVIDGYIWYGTNYSDFSRYYSVKNNVTGGNLDLDTKTVNEYFLNTTGKKAPTPNSDKIDIWGLFFLTKKNDKEPYIYSLDEIIQYQNTNNHQKDIRGLVEDLTSYEFMDYTKLPSRNGEPIFDTWIYINRD